MVLQCLSICRERKDRMFKVRCATGWLPSASDTGLTGKQYHPNYSPP